MTEELTEWDEDQSGADNARHFLRVLQAKWPGVFVPERKYAFSRYGTWFAVSDFSCIRPGGDFKREDFGDDYEALERARVEAMRADGWKPLSEDAQITWGVPISEAIAAIYDTLEYDGWETSPSRAWHQALQLGIALGRLMLHFRDHPLDVKSMPPSATLPEVMTPVEAFAST